MPPNEYYIKKLSDFSQETDDTLITPYFYQPTPEGVAFLCARYSTKYKIDLRCIDLQGKLSTVGDIAKNFEYLASINYLDQLENNQTIGLVITNGQNHCIPLLARKTLNKLDLVVFDSNSGASIKGYFKIANYFPNSNFYLNSGTRQVDSISCITDAVCVLKEALQLTNLFDLLAIKKFDDHPSLQPSQSAFFTLAKPAHFKLFKMPEQLLLSAQNSEYLTQANADLTVIIRGGKSLGSYRDYYRMKVSLTQKEGIIVAGINSYLLIKAREHKMLFDALALDESKMADEVMRAQKASDSQSLTLFN